MATQSVKDILNTEIPKPSFVLSPSVAAPLPSEMPFGESGTGTGRSGKDNVARTLDPYSGKFEHVPEDTPRVYGSDQGLLVEADSRTNYVLFSSDFDNTTNIWGTGLSASIGATANSLIEDETANVLSGGTNGLAQVFQESGSFSGGTEVAYAILEQKTANLVGLSVEDTTGGGKLTIEYDFSSESITQVSVGSPAGSIDGGNARVIEGTNGGTAIFLILRYSGFTSGNNRRVLIRPDRNGNGGDVYAHHAQIEEAPNASSPIVTQGSPVTRSGDDYAISKGDWWNSNEGTLLVDVVPKTYKRESNTTILGHSDFDVRHFYYTANTFATKDGQNIAFEEANDSSNKEVKLALSISQQNILLSVNSSSDKVTHNGNLLDPSRNLIIGKRDQLIAEIRRILYVPRALPESTLNTLTS